MALARILLAFSSEGDTIAPSIVKQCSFSAVVRRDDERQGGIMAVVLRAMTKGFTAAKYDELLKRLDAAGAGSPAGRLYHVCFGDPNELRVSDIWESRGAFEKFGETLRPLMEEMGLPAPEIEFFEVHNIIEGHRSAATAH
jgi:hypothetical protein